MVSAGALRVVWAPSPTTFLYDSHQEPDRSSGDRATASTPNDELFEQYQWNLRQIQATQAWELTTGSPSVTIAVLDTGVSPTHPDLAMKLVPGYDFVNDRAAVEDDHGNGTHVAGIAAAETNNRQGVAGIAWQAKIMPVKVLDASARGDPERAAQGVLWAVDHGANIINLGLAGPSPSQALDDAIRSAYERGVLVVAPVASNGTEEPSYPAASPHVVAVSATDRSDRKLPASNTGSYISVAAPGELIASTFRPPGGADGYAVASTTAQAAAQVTGVAALALAINPALRPDDLRAVLESSADDVAAPGYDWETGFGRVNAARAVLFAAPWNFFPQGAGSYAGQTTPANTVYLPLIMKDAGGWNTSVTIQNTSPRSTSMTLRFFDGSGRSVYTLPATLPPMGSATYHPARLPGLPTGFVGGAVVRADSPIAGVVNEDRLGRDRLTYEGFTVGARMIWVPLLMRASGDWDTGLQVQNLGTASTSARVTFYTSGASTALAETTLSLAPSGSSTLYQPADDRIPSDWVGSAVVESLDDQPLAAVVNQLRADGAAMAYAGVGQPAPIVYAPPTRGNSDGSTVELHVQNAGARTTVVVMSNSRAGGSEGPWLEERAIEPSRSVTFYRPANPELSDESVDGAVVQSADGEPLAAVLNEVRQTSSMATAYHAPTLGAESVFAPLLYHSFAGWNSGILLQNVGVAETSVTLTFYSEDGSAVAVIADSIDAGSSKSYDLSRVAGIRPGFTGSAVATAGSGQPLSAVVHHVK